MTIKPADTTSTKKDNQLIDELAKRFDLETDAELARRAGIPKQIISKVRNGERPLSIENRLMIANALGYAWARDVALFLMPEKVAAILKRADNLRTKRNDEKRATKHSK
jgi:transcriptional regulator with XRE-family HTH domain